MMARGCGMANTVVDMTQVLSCHVWTLHRNQLSRQSFSAYLRAF